MNICPLIWRNTEQDVRHLVREKNSTPQHYHFLCFRATLQNIALPNFFSFRMFIVYLLFQKIGLPNIFVRFLCFRATFQNIALSKCFISYVFYCYVFVLCFKKIGLPKILISRVFYCYVFVLRFNSVIFFQIQIKTDSSKI